MEYFFLHVTHISYCFCKHVLFNKDCTGDNSRWLDNIKMDRREIGWDGVDWVDTAQDRDQSRALLNTILNLPVP
jgi:hypothetical protein